MSKYHNLTELQYVIGVRSEIAIAYRNEHPLALDLHLVTRHSLLEDRTEVAYYGIVR